MATGYSPQDGNKQAEVLDNYESSKDHIQVEFPMIMTLTQIQNRLCGKGQQGGWTTSTRRKCNA
jgi:hypothetical protein